MGEQVTTLDGTAFVPLNGALYATVEEVTEPLRVSPSTIYRLIKAGQLPAIRVRHRLRVPRAAIDALHAEVRSTGGCVDVAEWVADWVQRNGAGVVA